MSKTEKTREQILAERQEKKKKKAALKSQPKDKNKSGIKGDISDNAGTQPIFPKNSVASFSNKEKEEKGTLKTGDSVEKPEVKKSENGIQSASHQVLTGCEVKKSEKESESLVDKQSHPKKQPETALKTIMKNDSGDHGSQEVVKTKAQLKAERRAKQEADRAKKLEKSTPAVKQKSVPAQPKTVQAVKLDQIQESNTVAPLMNYKVKLFAHLNNIQADTDTVDSSVDIHPSILQLRVQYSSRVISGANASVLALLNSLKKVVVDFETPPNQEFSRGLESEISKCMSYLNKYKPVAVSMVNAVKHLKFKVSQCKGNELECKESINEWIDTYIKEQLEMAAKAISLFVKEKISPGDVILTYGWSSLIHQILISAYNDGIKFQVIVADGRPWLEGKELLKKLVTAGIPCTYIFVNGLNYVMPEVTKILLGAHALLANGYVMSHIGSSQIALLAKTYNVPVLVCCETHKFSERVQTDSFVYNELGNPDDLVSSKGCLSKQLSKWKTIQCLTPLNLMYDVTPPDLVSAVVTEIAVLPCTSVPVILRIKPPDLAF